MLYFEPRGFALDTKASVRVFEPGFTTTFELSAEARDLIQEPRQNLFENASILSVTSPIKNRYSEECQNSSGY